MALISWNQDLSVEISLIDHQHQHLVSIINELHQAMLQGKGQIILGALLNRLTEYTDKHFAAEEQLFRQFNYPETEEHLLEHAEFAARLDDFKEAYSSGSVEITISLLDFLSGWLAKHIQIVDKRYAPFLRNKGVA